MVSYVSQATGTNTLTIPAHQAKDRFFLWALRDGSSSPPGLALGWQLLGTSLANSCSVRLFTREVLAGETVGDPTSASATNLLVVQYRPDANKRLDVGALSAFGEFASGTGSWTYNALTFQQDDSTSWALGFGAHRSGDTNMQAAPTGMTNRSNHVTASNEIAAHDTNGAVTGWGSQSVTETGTTGASATIVVEMREAADGVMPRYLGSGFSNVDGTSFTFTDMPVGDSDDGTQYHMAISARFAGTTAVTVSGVTCDAAAANVDVQVENSPLNGNVAALASIAVPSAATDVVVTFSATVVRCWIQVYRGNGTLADSGTSVANAPTTSDVALTAGGYALASVATGASSNVLTGTNIVAAPSSTLESASHHGSGYFAAVDAEAARVMTLTFANVLESVGVFAGYAVSSTDALLANDVESDSEVTSPAIGQVHAILANDVQSTSNVTAPALGQVHALLAADVESASEVTAPSVGQAHALNVADVQSASSVTAPAVGQVHVLNATDVQSASEVSAPTLAEATDALLADDVQSTSEVSSPALGQVHALAANDVESGSEVSSPTLSVVSETTFNPDTHDGGSDEDYRKLRQILRERRQRIQRLQAREEVLEERIEEVREDEPGPRPERGPAVSHETPRPSLAPLIAELQTIRSEIRALQVQDDEEAMTMLLVA